MKRAMLLLLILASCTADNQNLQSDRLMSLPYMSWSDVHEDDLDKSGVTMHDSGAYTGLNLYQSEDKGEAYLMDMEGNVLHSWNAAEGYDCHEECKWHHVEMDDQGNLYLVVKDTMLAKLSWESGGVGYAGVSAHHDMDRAENGDIYVLTREDLDVSYKGIDVRIANEYIIGMYPNSTVFTNISLYDSLGGELFIEPSLLKSIVKRIEEEGIGSFDAYHANTIEMIEKDTDFADKGDLLLSVREIDMLIVMDTEGEIKWTWGPGVVDMQHHPTMLENGNILLFDNQGFRNYSRVIELDPRTEKIVWTYPALPTEKFYSESRGSSQKLPNGNVLITESNKGHVIEVTTGGEIVWEWWNPEIRDGKREVVYRMKRLGPEQIGMLPFSSEVQEDLKKRGYIP
ncbi:MAG: arylsulfotransferase family protein [Nanoarchaeota archaeon]|nr:arylsulfotransferase family protein [Nanoarchaeota archaeon]